MSDAPNDPYYQQYPQDPQQPPRQPRRSRRRERRGVLGPILAALTVLGVLAGVGWYVTRDTTSPTSQNQPITTVTDDSSVTPTDDASTPAETPSVTPSETPSATPSKTPTKKPSATPTPTRATTPPSRQGGRTPRPTKTPSHTAVPKPSTKPPAPSGGAEAQVLQLTNNERAKKGCGPLRTNSALTKAADLYATDMVVHHYFDHNSQDGRSPFDRMKTAGFKGGSMAENIAVGYKSAAAVVEGWMNSEGHRKNILNCDYTMIGIGYDAGQVKSEWGPGSWVQDFGG